MRELVYKVPQYLGPCFIWSNLKPKRVLFLLIHHTNICYSDYGQYTRLGTGCGLGRGDKDEEDLDLPSKGLYQGRNGRATHSKNHKGRQCGQCPKTCKRLWDSRQGRMLSIQHDSESIPDMQGMSLSWSLSPLRDVSTCSTKSPDFVLRCPICSLPAQSPFLLWILGKSFLPGRTWVSKLHTLYWSLLMEALKIHFRRCTSQVCSGVSVVTQPPWLFSVLGLGELDGFMNKIAFELHLEE